MAKVGIGRTTIESLIDQVAVGSESGLNPAAVIYIKQAIAKAIDENNMRIAQNLESAGVRLKSNE